jgi:hypothetical protein
MFASAFSNSKTFLSYLKVSTKSTEVDEQAGEVEPV